MAEKKILDATCGSRTIWFNKHHPSVVYCDNRREEYRSIWKNWKGKTERQCVIDPDIQCDFTALPFPDDAFSLVVFDPPHVELKLHVSDQMLKDYKDCAFRNCENCSWNDVRIGNAALCGLADVRRQLSQEE